VLVARGERMQPVIVAAGTDDEIYASMGSEWKVSNHAIAR